MKFIETQKYYLPLIIILFFLSTNYLFAQDNQLKKIDVKSYQGDIEFDGLLNESFWKNADSIDGLTMVEPKENAPATLVPDRHIGRTRFLKCHSP